MTREDAKVLLPIIQAYAEGKEIEIFDKTTKMWKTAMLPHFNCDSSFYRIKPEPTYRPFKDTEECWTEMLKHQPFGWVKDKKDVHHRVLITAVDDDTCGMSLNGNAAWSLSGIMDLFTFADGTPFGVKVEE